MLFLGRKLSSVLYLGSVVLFWSSSSTQGALKTLDFTPRAPCITDLISIGHSAPLFEVRMIQSGFYFGNAQLKNEVQKSLDRLASELHSRSYQLPTEIFSLVENSPQTIRLALQPGADAKWRLEDAQELKSSYAHLVTGAIRGTGIFTKGVFGWSQHFKHKKAAKLFLLLSYPHRHSSFVLAHELAHMTNLFRNRKSLLWDEARSDWLAQTLVGEASIRNSNGEDIEFSKGKDDVTSESPRAVKDLAPDINAFHVNSQIITAFLTRAQETIGTQEIDKFVQWMDARSESQSLAPQYPNIRSNAEWEAFTKSEDQVRKVIEDELRMFGSLFKEWIKTTELDEASVRKLQILMDEIGF